MSGTIRNPFGDPFERYPLPWRQVTDAAHLIQAANGSLVASCIAWDDVNGVRWEADEHARLLVDAINSSDSLERLQLYVVAWADEAIGYGRDPAKALLKLFEELGEVIANPRSRLEWADVFIMLLDLAYLFGVKDLSAAITEKTEINRKRSWAANGAGVMKGATE